MVFVDTKELQEEGYSREDIKILINSIAFHHERDFVFSKLALKKEAELLKKELEGFEHPWKDSVSINKVSSKYFKNNRIGEENEELFYRYTMVKGLLNRIDYADSGGIDVEIENDFLLKNLEENLLEKFREKEKIRGGDPDKVGWNQLQKYMIDKRSKNLVVTAQTGMGKTEAGLLWIGNNKGFFTLPLKTAINAMYTRIVDSIVLEGYENKVGLLHSDIRREYLDRLEKVEGRQGEYEIDFDEYYDRTRQLSLPLTVCTIDQIFTFVYRYRGFEPVLATLAYSKIVIDEVQMYSPDLLAYLILGLYYIDKVGGKFAILTATLPPIFVDLLKKEGVDFEERTFTNKMIRHSLKVVKKRLDVNFIREKYRDNKILVICNTVGEAQRVYKELKDSEGVDGNIWLFHSGFIKKDRKEKERSILDFARDNNRDAKGIWVTTQVVEASLDIDFDLLITELSDLNGLFQRMGRCYRGREWDSKGYNCFVFDGGDKRTSGIGHVIDKDIFNLSKDALEGIDGEIDEDKKIELINSVYTLEKLKESKSDYYRKFVDSIQYLRDIEANEKSKSDAKRRFRDIESKNLMPRSIYEENRGEIEENMAILKESYSIDMEQEDRKNLKMRKMRARLELEDLKLSVSMNRIGRGKVERIEINRYEALEIFDCIYDRNRGIEYQKDETSQSIGLDERISSDF